MNAIHVLVLGLVAACGLCDDFDGNRGEDGILRIKDAVGLRPALKISFKVQSPGYPDLAPGKLERKWLLVADPGVIKLTCKVLALPMFSNGTCSDYALTIEDGGETTDYCGGMYDHTWISKTDRLRLTLKTGYHKSGTLDCVAKAKLAEEAEVESVEEEDETEASPTRASYLTVESEEIDSSEHGLAPGVKPTTCTCGTTNKNTLRIIGGEETMENEYPFAVMLRFTGSTSPFCGGSIITRRHVLTAAHCVVSFVGYSLSVVAGDHDYSRDTDTSTDVEIEIGQIIIHEDYLADKQNDIALLVLKTEIEYSRNIQPACIPHTRFNLEREYVKALGWGRTSVYGQGSVALKKVNLRVVSRAECHRAIGIDETNPKMLCTFSRNQGLAKGDSGGPVVWLNKETNRYTLVGLPSYVFFYNTTNVMPDASCDVSAFLPWIHSKLKATAPEAQACWAVDTTS